MMGEMSWGFEESLKNAMEKLHDNTIARVRIAHVVTNFSNKTRSDSGMSPLSVTI